MLLTVAYDGGPFSGFALQPNARTIAGELLGAVREMDPRVNELRGASRTDAGVHARGQSVAFDTETSIPPRGWALGLARHLPSEIAVVRAGRVATGFSPRFSNQGKRYAYRVLCSRTRDPFWEGRAWRLGNVSPDVLLETIRSECPAAIGEHDFVAFRSSSDERPSSIRTLRVYDGKVDPSDARVVRIDVEGNAFLHNMVRILVGTVVDVARGRKPQGALGRALTSRLRADAGDTAPPSGLYLEEVLLDVHLTDPWP